MIEPLLHPKFADSFPFQRFLEHPDRYILCMRGNQIFAEEKGLITWMKARLSLFFERVGDYRLNRVVKIVRELIEQKIISTDIFETVDRVIYSYNKRHLNDRKLIYPLSYLGFFHEGENERRNMIRTFIRVHPLFLSQKDMHGYSLLEYAHSFQDRSTQGFFSLQQDQKPIKNPLEEAVCRGDVPFIERCFSCMTEDISIDHFLCFFNEQGTLNRDMVERCVRKDRHFLLKRDCMGCSLIEYASYLDSQESVDFLFDHGSSPPALNPLKEAGSHKNEALLRRLVQSVRGQSEIPELMYAAVEDENENTLLLLLRSGGRVSYLDPRRGSLLHHACSCRKTRIVRVLVREKALVDQKNGDGKTALHIAVFQEVPEIVEFLLQSDASVDALDDNQETPLDMAISANAVSIARLLLAKRANVHREHYLYGTPLDRALLHPEHHEMIQLLEENGALGTVLEKQREESAYSQTDDE